MQSMDKKLTYRAITEENKALLTRRLNFSAKDTNKEHLAELEHIQDHRNP